MSDKNKLVAIDETRLSYMAGMLLKEIAQGLSQRSFEFQTPTGTTTVSVPKEVNIEYSVKQKCKDGQSKTKMEIEISWSDACPASACCPSSEG